jgi:hypothetical protein
MTGKKRRSLIEKILSGEIRLPFSHKVDNVDREHKGFYQTLYGMDENKNINVSKDKDKGSIWFFWRRKK